MVDLPQEVPDDARPIIEYEALIGDTRVIVDYKVGPEWHDALHYTRAEYEALTPEVMVGEIQRRYDNWKLVVSTPRPEPTEEEKAAMLTSMKEQLDMLQNQILQALPDEESKLAFIQERAAVAEPLMLTLQQAIDAKVVVIRDGGGGLAEVIGG